MNFPRISVVMSVFNGSEYLFEAIQSILYQNYENFEFIIIDDGSTDNSLEIIRSFDEKRIKLIHQNNTGLAIALNKGIAWAKGQYIARMDADDVSEPNRFEKQLEFLDNNVDYIAIGSNARIIDKDGNNIYISSQPLSWEEIRSQLPRNPFFHSSTMYLKEKYDLVKGYPPLPISQDIVFFNKLARVGKLANLEDPLIKYRLSPSAVTQKSSEKEDKIIQNIVINCIDNEITLEEIDLIKQILQKKNKKKKEWFYHLLLAKKYLWNNYRPTLARLNLKKAFLLKPSITIMPLVLLSLMPKRIIILLYNSFKKYF